MEKKKTPQDMNQFERIYTQNIFKNLSTIKINIYSTVF